MTAERKKYVLSTALILVAVALLIPIYNAPIWWVSLEAPNYPEEAFPDGVRILFHLNGVFNGCEMVEKDEILTDEALDCVHEMDTINHYVGMYPIASGGPVELYFSIFLLGLVAVMVLAFASRQPLLRVGIMAVGFATVAIWMGLSWFATGGLKYHNAGYLDGRITVLGEGADEESEAEMTPGEALIARLKASMAETEPTDAGAGASADPQGGELDEKSRSIAYLQDSFAAYQQRKGAGGTEQWQGSGSQFVAWHYEKSLGRYFRDSERLRPMVARMSVAANIVFAAILGIMVLLLVMARKPRGIFNWLLICIPMTLPLLFIVEYAAWLWWYGHNMSSLGAFTLKPFMPTVFGQGKVAQFTSNSYPDIGFWLIVLFSALLLAAALLRRQEADDQVTGTGATDTGATGSDARGSDATGSVATGDAERG